MPLVERCYRHKSSSSQHDLALAATRCADQCSQISDRFQQFESMSVLVALEVVFIQQAVLELRHVEHNGDPFQVQTLQCGRRVAAVCIFRDCVYSNT